jgi:hypothetical protein
MATTLTDVIATAYACETVGDAPSLDIIPGLDGSGSEPILTRPIFSEEVISEAERVITENGWEIVDVASAGQLRQPGHWTNAGDYYVTSIVPEGTDTTCDSCGSRSAWVVTDDREIVCSCTLGEQ